MNCTISTPTYHLLTGKVYDVPSALGKEVVGLKSAAGIAAAEIVTDPKERAKARPFRLNPAEQAPAEDGWIGGDGNE